MASNDLNGDKGYDTAIRHERNTISPGYSGSEFNDRLVVIPHNYGQ